MILWQSNNAPDKEVNKKEIELILKYEPDNPKIGCNRNKVQRERELVIETNQKSTALYACLIDSQNVWISKGGKPE